MATPVSICSNALLLLGAQTINAFDEPFERAKIASNLYPDVRDWLLRSHPWNCATKRVQLAPDAAAPLFDYPFQFSLPADWLKTVQVGEIGLPVDYKSEGRKILAFDNPLDLVYIFRQVEGAWDSQLVWAATVAMSAAMAYAITKSGTTQTNQYNALAALLRQARSADGMDDPPETLGDFRLIASRFTASTGATFR